MANQERGEVGIEVDGRVYTLRPSLNAFCAVEDLTGQDFEQIEAEAGKGRPKAMRALLWTFLQDVHGDEIKTLEDAGRWVQRAGGIASLSAKFEQLVKLNAAPPDPAAKVNGRPPKAQDGRRGAASTSTPGASPT